MSVSIVIATADRPEIVLACVRGFREQVPPDVELVVVDAGQEAPVDAGALQTLWPNSRVIRSAVRNAGAQRNAGVLAARGEVIVFLDDDCFVQPGWWPAIVAPLRDDATDHRPQTIDCRPRGEEDHRPETIDHRPRGEEDHRPETIDHRPEGEEDLRPETLDHRPEEKDSLRSTFPQSNVYGLRSKVSSGRQSNVYGLRSNVSPSSIAAVAGAVWCNPHPVFTDRRGGYVNWLGFPVQVTHRSNQAPRDVDWPMTTNMAVRKDVFTAVGGFATVYGIYDEDVDFGLKLRRAGWGIRFVPEAAVYHYYRRRPARPVTKHSQFMLGRNRSLLLVRNYGLLSRVWLHMAVGAVQQTAGAVWAIARGVTTAVGHSAAYVVGMVWGVWVGWRHPVTEDGKAVEEVERERRS